MKFYREGLFLTTRCDYDRGWGISKATIPVIGNFQCKDCKGRRGSGEITVDTACERHKPFLIAFTLAFTPQSVRNFPVYEYQSLSWIGHGVERVADIMARTPTSRGYTTNWGVTDSNKRDWGVYLSKKHDSQEIFILDMINYDEEKWYSILSQLVKEKLVTVKLSDWSFVRQDWKDFFNNDD